MSDLELNRLDLALLYELRLKLLMRKAQKEDQTWTIDETLAWIDQVADAKRSIR